MNITFRQLRLFLALAETGSVSAAARVMHVTQPTASMQLREVTQAVGLPLYEVVSRRVHLTEAGQALARTARAIAGEWDAFEQRVAGAKGLTSGRLRVAVVSTAAMGMTQDLNLWVALRFVSGLSSTAGLLIASGLVLNWLIRHGHRPELGLHFAGIGLGIVVSGLAVAAIAPGGTASIPTLSEWGLILLSLLMAMLGLSRMRRRSCSWMKLSSSPT